MHLSHWRLHADPFAAPTPAYVATTAHDEALGRLLRAVDRGERRVDLRGASGLGKSTVLREALARARTPGRRTSLVGSPVDGPTLLAALAGGLGARPRSCPSRAEGWKTLADAVRLARLQGLGVLLAVDDDHHLGAPADLLDLRRLEGLDPHPRSRLTVLRAGLDADDAPEADRWPLSIRLRPLTRGEAAAYLAARLLAAGRDEPAFTPRALTLLHALTGGVPRGLDRLAGLALVAGAERGVEIVGPELVEGVAEPFLPRSVA